MLELERECRRWGLQRVFSQPRRKVVRTVAWSVRKRGEAGESVVIPGLMEAAAVSK